MKTKTMRTMAEAAAPLRRIGIAFFNGSAGRPIKGASESAHRVATMVKTPNTEAANTHATRRKSRRKKVKGRFVGKNGPLLLAPATFAGCHHHQQSTDQGRLSTMVTQTI
jgi:hypothetical protein